VTVQHFLLTQFSIPASQAPGRHRDPSWLRFRLNLLEEMGAPSVRAQTAKDFRWILLIDERSADWVVERLRAITGDLPVALLLVGDLWSAQLDEFLGKQSGGSLLVTSQMDSDDAISPDFVRCVQAHAGPDRVVNASVGARYDVRTRSLVRVRKKRASESVCSTQGRHIFQYYHGTAGLEFPSIEIAGEPLWVQTIHGGNLANRSMRGFPITEEGLFPWLSGKVRRPTVGDYVAFGREELRQLQRRSAQAVAARVMSGRTARARTAARVPDTNEE
jgi:hypothetical protein